MTGRMSPVDATDYDPCGVQRISDEIPFDQPVQVVVDSNVPMRFDRFLVVKYAAYSRNFFQQLIEASCVSVNGQINTKSSALVRPGDVLVLTCPSPRVVIPVPDKTKDLPVRVVYEHADFLIIDKPPRLMVHPPSHRSTAITLVDWIISHFQEIGQVGYIDRPGIVHRLDKDTSGLLVIPRTIAAHAFFTNQFKTRQMRKTYYAVVDGVPSSKGVIDFKIGRHPTENRMTHIAPDGRESVTEYSVIQQFTDAALLALHPVTGRTHQLRVHCAAIGHPIIGDPIYGKRSALIDRQALHAATLEFTYKGEPFVFNSPLPADIEAVLTAKSQAHAGPVQETKDLAG